MAKYIFFDLDGTLTDPGLGITDSVWYALKKFGTPVESRAELYRFIGPPLIPSFQEFYGYTEEQSNQALIYYREYFTDKGMFENEPYEGITDTLEKLRAAGKTLIVATSKPEEFSVKILEHFGLAQYFDYICGASMDESSSSSRTTKEQVIAYALETAGITDKSDCIMIGDRKHDIDGAHRNGMEAIGVLYGYGDEEELLNAGAEYIVERHEDLLVLL